MEKRRFMMLGVFGALILIFCIGLTTLEHENDTDINQIRDQLNFSGFCEISPIVIDNSGAEGLRWEEVESELWCDGLGSLEEPYVIENIIINGNGVGDCLLIQNSDVYFIIRNSIFYNSGNTNSPAVEAGIKLNNVDNGQLINNTCYDNGNGIKLIDCNNIIITENTLYDNVWWGIDFGWYHTSGSYNVISRNIVSNNLAGISGASSGYECTGNLISENVVDNNNHYGIILGNDCYDNIIMENNVTNNGFGGIGASGITLGGHDNLVYLNLVSGNYRNSNDAGVNNQWDNGIIGNYWDDYGGVDFDDNGIGDTPYLIYGSAGSQDNFPIWDDGDDPPYDITINATGVSTNIKIDGFPYIGIGGVASYGLEAGTYPIYSYPGGSIASFNIDVNGFITYDQEYEGVLLTGAGTKTLSIVGSPIFVDSTGVSTNITIFGLPEWLKFRGTESLYLPSGSEIPYKLIAGLGGISVGLLPNTTFTITNTGTISYDPIFNGKTLKGLGTSTLEVLGYPIAIDTTGVSTNITLYGMKYWFKFQEVKTLYLPPDTEYPYRPLAGLGGYSIGRLLNASFTVTKTGKVSYDPIFNGKTLNGLGTSTLKILGYPIAIDTTGVSTNITLYGMKYWFKFQEVKTLYLPPDTEYPYRPAAGLGGYSIGRLLNATFTVTKAGKVSYDPFFNGKTLNGLGTSNLEIIGYPINIDNTGVSTNITLYGLKYWFKFQDIETMYLPPDTEYPYRPLAGLGGFSIGRLLNATFMVTKAGKVSYDPFFNGKTLNGLGTSNLEIVGYPITVDASEVSTRITLLGMKYYIDFQGIETFFLPPDIEYPYRICSELGGILEETFIVRKDGTVDPTEIIYEYGIIRFYSDIAPPITSISLSGTAGNNGWYVSDVYVTLTATDSSGIEKTEYCIDGINWIEYSGTFPLNLEGITTLQYRSIDTVGNVEDINTLEIEIDKSLPESELAMSNYYTDLLGDIYVTTSTEFTISSIDQISGIATSYYSINGGTLIEYSESFTLIGSDGVYIIEYYSIDLAGNVELVNSIAVNLANFEIDSYLSKGEGNPITYFDLIFTKCKQTGEYKLVATNPGQMFYIIEFTNNWPTSVENLNIEIIIPNDFQLELNDPIIIYLDGIDITADCIINGNLITIQNIPSDSVVKVVVHLDYGLKGNTYPSLDDFGMVGYVFNAVITGLHGDSLIIDDGLEQSSQDSASLITHQKKTTAIAGYVYDIYGNPIEGATVELFLNGIPIKSILTDENGFFYFIDIEVGIYEVHVFFGGITEIQVAVASKDELTEVNFEIEYDIP